MLRQLFFAACLLMAAGSALAGEAGRIVFVVGQANIANHGINQGDAVHEGDEISTGPDGYIYVKTVDNGFLILRPSSRARIVNYHVDRNDPKNTRIKFELLSGVARSISGEAVKEARQNFRFNTPVAAIGVRGTDFTVFTDADTSRVAVISGGIVVSAFHGACGPEGSGPCEGKSSHELFANQLGQMLQVKRGQAAPQLLPSTMSSLDATAPQRPDEPVSKPTQPTVSGDPSLDQEKLAKLAAQQTKPTPTEQPSKLPPVVVVENNPPSTNVPEVQVVPVVPYKEIMWGRYKEIVGQPAAQYNLATLATNGKEVVRYGAYAIYLAKDNKNNRDWDLPVVGSASFGIRTSEAMLTDQKSLDPKNPEISMASVENGKFTVDFGKKTFDTSFDLRTNKNEVVPLRAQGTFTSQNGLLNAANPNMGQGTNMYMGGLIGPGGNSAYYAFSKLLSDQQRLATGLISWGK
ncbi:MAG: FecR domain-containing protein [Burkholderiales bacterium]|nr:FecR domain-containing protein [Burkholderiales bacterium]